MKISWPLYSRILGWFFLNLLILAAVFAAFFRFQFQFGLDSLLAGKAGERMEALSALISSEIREKPPEEWSATLLRFDTAYGANFGIFRPDGRQIAGQAMPLPEVVRVRLDEMHQRPRPPAPLQPGQPIPPRQPPGAWPPLQREDGPRNPTGPPPTRTAMLHTENPGAYWIVSRLPPMENLGRGPVFLVTTSKSLSFGGLVLDPYPWLAVGSVIIVLSVAFWWPLVRGITRAISQMTAATEKIAAGHFDTRVPETRTDEIGTLGAAINRMAGRLDGFIQGQKRFLGDTAHELVSPLARMEMALGILDQRAGEENRLHIEDVREEVQQMSRLVNDLLSFSRASLGGASIHLQPVALLELVRHIIQRESLGSDVRLEMTTDFTVLADPDLLQRAFGNVLRNAIRYAGTAGPITVSASMSNGQILLSICDRGPGIPQFALAQLGDPFFRLDPSRDRETGGTGLGLAITKTCVEACGGTVFFRNREPHGLEVTISLNVG